MRDLNVLFADNLRISASWAIDDDEWFLDHPTRSHRLRAAWAHEPEDIHYLAGDHPDGFEAYVIVRQIRPDYRLRLFVWCDPVVAADAAEIEEIVHAMFDLMDDGRDGVSPDDVVALARQYGNAGHA